MKEEKLFDLDGYIVVITGGGGVIAGAMALALVRAGAKVSLWGRGKSRPVEEVAEELASAAGCRGMIHARTVDAGEKAELEESLRKTIEDFGTPSCLINGVGGNRGKSPFNEAGIDLFREVLDLNIFAGLVLPTQVFTSFWIENKLNGNIINIASMASYIPLSGVWAYGAAKSAVMNLTMAAAKEFAPHGIRVNGIAPGFFIGDQNRRLLIANDETGELTERGKAVIDHTPFGRFGDADELGGVTVFLVSEKASGFVTGTTIPVDGGYLIQNI